ncbi:MAG: hypothetical protein PHN75_10105 [Syntrophales bacterium]|nr:hypothetical protein [Syntrophales bacterium]
MATNIKIPYEPPRIIDLAAGNAQAQDLAFNCTSGSTPAGYCQSGSTAQIYKCQSGSSAGSARCQAGGSPGSQCTSGSTAYGGKCQSGSVASQACWAGSVPGK